MRLQIDTFVYLLLSSLLRDNIKDFCLFKETMNTKHGARSRKHGFSLFPERNNEHSTENKGLLWYIISKCSVVTPTISMTPDVSALS